MFIHYILYTHSRTILLAFVFLIFCTIGAWGTQVHASTIQNSDVIEDTVWTASSSPYIITENIEVASATTLTIQPGTIVKVETSRSLTVKGSLSALGSGSEQIFITSSKDDTVGGDSNGNGTSTSPASGDWQGIRFASGSQGVFEYTTISYTGYTGRNNVGGYAGIHNEGGDVRITSSEIRHGKTCSVGQTAGTITIENTLLSNNEQCGVALLGGTGHIEDNTVESSQYGTFIKNAEVVTLINNSFIDNQVAVDVALANAISFTNEGNTASGGSNNGIIIRDVITSDIDLSADSMPYMITSSGGSGGGRLNFIRENNLTVSPLGSLTFEKGVVVKFINSGALFVDGIFRANGTTQEKIHFTSIKDDSVGGDTNGDGSTTAPAAGDWLHLRFNSGSEGVLENISVRYAGHRFTGGVKGSSLSNIFNTGGTLSISQSEIAYAHSYGVSNVTGTTTISQSTIHDNPVFGVINDTQAPVLDARNNYWGDLSGPFHSLQNPAGLGDQVSNNVLFKPWKGVHCTESCYSNVLFLPGIKGSRLYTRGLLGSEDRIWEPFGNQDVWQMEMTDEGESVHSVYTKDIIKKAYGGLDIYNSFDQFMTNLIDEDVIRDWTSFAYDWRYDVETIAQNGAQYENALQDAVDEIERLSQSSLSGKVTIIGHSNGGLLAKAIMQRLEDEGRTDLVDKVVFLASPQLGTPLAIGSILHGYGESQVGDLLIDDAVAREVILNMPGSYGLLPSQEYFNEGPGLKVLFDTSDSTSAFRAAYGNAINTEAELIEFMSGYGDNRGEAATVHEAARANRSMLEKASILHSTVLDNWIAPDGVEIIEVVGVGLDTVSGFQYVEFSERVCSEPDIFGQQTCENTKFYKPKPFISQYGDGVVMGHSAEGYEGEKEAYYLNLDASDMQGGPFGVEHGDITETPSVQMLLRNIIEGKDSEIQFVSKSSSNFDRNRVMFGANSPVRVKAADSTGAEVGIMYIGDENIPVANEEVSGSRYFELGDSKYLILPTDLDYEINIEGTGEGGLVLTVDLLEGEIQTPLHQISVATITASTTVRFSYNDESLSNLLVDIDGDGEIDQEVTPEGEIVSSEVTYGDLVAAINELSLKKAFKKPIITLATLAKKFQEKALENQGADKLELLILNKLEDALELYVKLRLLTNQEVEDVLQIIQKLKTNHESV